MPTKLTKKIGSDLKVYGNSESDSVRINDANLYSKILTTDNTGLVSASESISPTEICRKVETYNLQATAENITEITISHSLGDIPSSVQMYILNTATDEYEMFNADVVATDTRIKIRLSSSLPIGTKYYVKALI